MSISFNSIPFTLRTPGQYIEIDNTRAVRGLPAVLHRVLIIGQRLAAGSVAQHVPTRMLTAAQAEENFGRGSQMAAMVAAFKAANSFTELWCVAQDDNVAGAAATGTVTFGGSPTETGTLNAYIGGKLVQTAITSGATASTIATAFAAAVNADTSLPVTAAAVAAVVTLTARNKGEAANGLDVRMNYYDGERTPKGMTVAIVAIGGGTGNPDVQGVITAIGDQQYHTVVCPYTDASNLTKLEALLNTRWGPLVQKEGHAFVGFAGTHGATSTFGNTRNSPFLTIMAAGKSPSPAYVWAAVAAAVDSFEPDPARPRQALPLPGLLPPAVPDRYTLDERNLLLYAGVSTTLVDAGGLVLVERLITSYKTNAFGVQDISYLNIETMRTVAYLRLTLRARIALKFPRHKLASDGTRFAPGQAVVTPTVIRSELVALFQDWEEAGLVENIEQFKQDLLVERDSTDPDRMNAIVPPDCINQFRVFAAQLQFRL